MYQNKSVEKVNVKWLLAITLFIGFSISALGQNLDSLLNTADKPKRDFAFATFKGTKVLNSQSVENVGKGVLQVIFQHRFAPVNNGFYDFFGLDGAGIRFGFDYGVTQWLTAGVGRSGGGMEPFGQKAYDGYLKCKLLRQSTGAVQIPVSVSLFGSTAIRSANSYDVTDGFNYRLFYTAQLLIARKFSPYFSMQLMPTLIHRNLTLTPSDKNTIFAFGAAARCKLTKRFGLVGEYYYVPGNQLDPMFYNQTAALGIEIETGGHVYHLLFTNAAGMIEHQFIGYNMAPLASGARSIRFGFNLSRVFTIVKPKI